MGSSRVDRHDSVLPSAYDGGHRFRFGPAVVGLALHEATSAAMGLAYVPLVRYPVLARRPVVTAVGYALVSWAAYQYGIMPSLAPVMDRHVSPVGLAIAHVAFGLVLGGYAGQVMAGRSAASGVGKVNESLTRACRGAYREGGTEPIV